MSGRKIHHVALRERFLDFMWNSLLLGIINYKKLLEIIWMKQSS